MKPVWQPMPPAYPLLAWLTAALAGIVAPAIALLLLADARGSAPLELVGGPILAVGLMGAGMIGAAAAGRLSIGIFLALLTGAGLFALARFLGLPPLQHPPSILLALVAASLSFAARGALFARSALSRGWWIAVFVVGGEAAILSTAYAMPGALPDWLLALLPAQWASMAIQTALIGTDIRAAAPTLAALVGTAATTLLVAWLWPRRWPYLIMFTAWLGFSALVWYQQPSTVPQADRAISVASAKLIAQGTSNTPGP